MYASNYFCIFYLFELKLCRMVELCIPKNPPVFQFHKIDTRLTTKFKFQVMAKEINNLERV